MFELTVRKGLQLNWGGAALVGCVRYRLSFEKNQGCVTITLGKSYAELKLGGVEVEG